MPEPDGPDYEALSGLSPTIPGKEHLDIIRPVLKEGESNIENFGKGIASEAAKIFNDMNGSPEGAALMGEHIKSRIRDMTNAKYPPDDIDELKKVIGTELKSRFPNLDIVVTSAKETEIQSSNPPLAKEILGLIERGSARWLTQLEVSNANGQLQIKENQRIGEILKTLLSEKNPSQSPQLEALVQALQPLIEQSLQDLQKEEAELVELQDLQSGKKQDAERLKGLATKFSFGRRFRDRGDMSGIANTQQRTIENGVREDQVEDFNRRMIDALAYKIAQKK